MSAWTELESEEYDRVWDRFYDQFQFRPSVHRWDWPGIVEPEDSVTYSISHVYDGDEEAYVARTNDLGSKLIAAFRRCTPENGFIYVLDWQHPCYSFRPHRGFQFASEEDWPVPALPNGDYYIFLTCDLGTGVFGHPWEQTMCVFGAALREALNSDPPFLFDRVVRVGGKAI